MEMFAGLLGGGFVLQALLKLGSERKSRETSAAVNTASAMTVGFSIITGALLLIFRNVLDSFYSGIDLQGVIPYIVLAAFTGSLAQIPRHMLLTRLGTGKVMFIDLLVFTVRGGIVGYLIISGKLTGVIQVLRATASANAAAFIMGTWAARGIPDISAGFTGTAFKRVMSFAAFSLGTSLAGFIYTRTDILMLGKLASAADTAAYSASRALTSMVVLVSAAANMVLMPLISRAWSENRRKETLKLVMKAIGIVELIQLPVVILLVFFSEFVINTVYDGRYLENWPILAILGTLALIRPFGSLFSSAGTAMNRPQYSFWSVLISAGVNVALNLWLIPELGGTGAALATAAAVVAGAGSVVVFTVRRYRQGVSYCGERSGELQLQSFTSAESKDS